MIKIASTGKYSSFTFPCKCGKHHTVPTRTMLYEEQAIEKLPKVLSECTSGRQVILIADERTYPLAGIKAQEALRQGDWETQTLIVADSDHGPPVCDDVTFEKLKRELREADIMLAVGSGVINDLTKWLAFDSELPYAVLATAASMNGYTAANVAPTLDGVKSIIYAAAPVACLAVPSLIENAPFEMTASGLGDVIAKPISTADWIMNHFLFDEYFCAECTELINALEPYYFDHPEKVRDRNPEAVGALYQALLNSGIAMTMVGSSAPASGGEHMLSHTLDMMASLDTIPHDLHGRQVGVGTIFAAALYEKIFQIDAPACVAMPGEIDREFWGKLAEPVARQYALKQTHLVLMREKILQPSIWKSLLEKIRDKVRTPGELKNCLRLAGAAYRYEDIRCTRTRVRQAVVHMHEIRKRCTVVDLAWMVGVLPNAADELIDKYLA
jgi:glycerol-1-phosphate dehydrogenase [NAD(P)+]